MNASYQASLVNRHIRRFTGFKPCLPKTKPTFVVRYFNSRSVLKKATGNEELSNVKAKILYFLSRLETETKAKQHITYVFALVITSEAEGRASFR